MLDAPAPDARPVFVAVDAVVRRASMREGVTVEQLRGAQRDRRTARARWAVMMVLRDAGMSTPQIGRTLGDRDHTTVLHGLREGAALAAKDDNFAGLVGTLRTAWAAARSG
jgi:chromosomal replication initiation ATPase DnaA